jgi:hypothetical protein
LTQPATKPSPKSKKQPKTQRKNFSAAPMRTKLMPLRNQQLFFLVGFVEFVEKCFYLAREGAIKALSNAVNL